MKNIKKTLFILTAALNGFILCAETSFSGVVAGNTGINGEFPTNGSKPDIQIPLSAFAAGQVDIADTITARGEIDIRGVDFPFTKLFEGNDATIRIHELSVVFTKPAITSTHFFSGFLGFYEPIGCDTFLMRQFGIDAVSSSLTQSVTNIAGAPLYSNSGAGVSYISRLENRQVSLGGYLYFFKNEQNNLVGNLDFRIATVMPALTLDFIAGIGAPLRDNGVQEGDDYVVAIKTITLHSGLNLYLGNKYTHGLLIQVGLNRFVLNGRNSMNFKDADFCFVIEPRIRSENFGLNLTLYSLNKENVESLLYISDPIGFGATAFFDAIETKRGIITAGIHGITSVGGDNSEFTEIITGGWENLKQLKLNLYISPYVEIPTNSSSNVELMGQVGLMDITSGKPALNFKAIAGFRKQF